MDEKTAIINVLRRKGMRITQQKKAILDVFADNPDKMLSVSDIAEILGGVADNATVYRNVRRFLELGIIETITDSRGVQRFVVCCDGKHHHHLICTSCGRIINFPCDTPFWRLLAEQNGFAEQYHRIEVYGMCSQCQKT